MKSPALRILDAAISHQELHQEIQLPASHLAINPTDTNYGNQLLIQSFIALRSTLLAVSYHIFLPLIRQNISSTSAATGRRKQPCRRMACQSQPLATSIPANRTIHTLPDVPGTFTTPTESAADFIPVVFRFHRPNALRSAGVIAPDSTCLSR